MNREEFVLLRKKGQKRTVEESEDAGENAGKSEAGDRSSLQFSYNDIFSLKFSYITMSLFELIDTAFFYFQTKLLKVLFN